MDIASEFQLISQFLQFPFCLRFVMDSSHVFISSTKAIMTIHRLDEYSAEQVKFFLQEFLLFKDGSFGWVAKHQPPARKSDFLFVLLCSYREKVVVCRGLGGLEYLLEHRCFVTSPVCWPQFGHTLMSNRESQSSKRISPTIGPIESNGNGEMGKERRSFSLSCVSSSFLSFHRVPWAPSSSFSPHFPHSLCKV